MTIEQLDKVDIIAHDEEKVTLVISDHLEWDDQNEKLLLLQESSTFTCHLLSLVKCLSNTRWQRTSYLKFRSFQNTSLTIKLKNSFYWH